MNRDIRVEFLDGGPGAHALYLLDSMEAGDDFNGWDTNTAAFDWFGLGLSVVMPVGGKSSFYSDWYGPATGNGATYTYKWETFLTQELPAYLAANKNVPQTGNAIVGLSMGGSSALILAAYHPQSSSTRGPCRASSTSPRTGPAWSDRADDVRHGGFDPRQRCGVRPATRPGPATTRPSKSVGSSTNGTRIWIYCGNGTPADPNLASPDAPIGGLGFLEGFAIDSNHAFVYAYVAAGGKNGVLNFPDGIHSWGYWGSAAAADETGHSAGASCQARRLITTTDLAVRA